MRTYITHKNGDKIHLDSSNSQQLIKNGLSVIIFKTREDVDVILFNSNELQYGSVIKREIEKEKQFIKAGVLDLDKKNGNLVGNGIIPNLVDKQYRDKVINKEEIFDICLLTELELNNILGK